MYIIIAFAVVLILVALLIGIGIREHNKDAKEKGTSEKGYTVWSVIAGILVAIPVLFYELFIKRPKRY
jgi:hypothetical protein